MSRPLFRHKDATQIWVSFEAYAKKVEDFAFVIVGARPDRGDGLDCRIGTGDEGTQADALLIAVGKNVVAQLEAGFGREPVDSGDIFEEVVPCSLHGGRRLADGFGNDGEREFVAVKQGVSQSISVPGNNCLDSWVVGEAFQHLRLA